MTINEITNAISTVGFPILCCAMMWKFINTSLHDFTKAMDNNSKMLDKLCSKIDLIRKEVRNDN